MSGNQVIAWRDEASRIAAELSKAEVEVERLNQVLDMLAEQREAWKAQAEWLRAQNAELHRQIEYARALAWDHIPDKDIVDNLRRMLDRPKK